MTPSGSSGRRSRRKARADCRAERHRFGSEQPIGGGIVRRVCLACGAVSIDLTGAEPVSSAISRQDSKSPDRR